MPQTLVLGSQGEAVKLLQRTLNQRPPTALPLLWVDGDFGPVTLGRVKEFQRHNGLWVDGVVGPITWGKLLDDQPIQRDTLYVKGRYLYDAQGKKIILRGINLPLLDNWDFPQRDRSGKLPELAKTGANTVRIQWHANYGNPDRLPYSLADLDDCLTQCKIAQMLPILALWDVTCKADITLLDRQIISWWTSDSVLAVLKKHQRYLIINLANELGHYRWTGHPTNALLHEFRDAYKTAISRIRQHLHGPIMIDAPDGGSTIEVFTEIGQELIDHDPDHNLLLSGHAYWAAYDGFPHLNAIVQANLPIVFGEIANKQDEIVQGEENYCYYDLDGYSESHPPQKGFTYQALLQTLQDQEIGWLAWSWWKDGCAARQMTENGNFSGLTRYGKDLVHNPVYGLQATAQRSHAFDG